MKKLFLITQILVVTTLVLTSCLKDKGFENKNYGINDPDSQPPGVSFPLSSKAFFKNNYSLNLTASSQDVTGIVFVKLNSGKPAASDVKVTLAINDALRTSFNAANNPDIELMPSSLYTMASTLIIPAGSINAEIPIKVSNTTSLDPNKSYGIGITISAVDGGYIVAENQKNILVNFAIKNQYEGDYHSTGYFYHPAVPRPQDEEKFVQTSGINSVDVYLGDLGTSGYIGRFTIDGSNNVTIVAAPGAAGGAYTMFTSGLPTTNPGYTPQWAGSALCNNRYDPLTKTFFVRYGYMGGSGWRVTEEQIVKQ